MKYFKMLVVSLKVRLITFVLGRKIKKIASNMRDVNKAMALVGWDRQRRREYWRNVVTQIKKFG
jgi:hypothetical protein